MCNCREPSRAETRFVVMGTGNCSIAPVADCETMEQASRYVEQMADTYKTMGLTLSISEVQTFPFE